ncbi:MAG: glutamine-hydrolyzing GMP synthase, partial [Nitrososphaerales archaeon]
MRDTASLEKILVLDFGAQYAHLICRRIRELGVYAELVPFDIAAEEITAKKARGLVFSGGPKSVYAKGAPLPHESVYDLHVPILGICYGLQAIVHQKGGKVLRASRHEYGKASLKLRLDAPLFKGLGDTTVCWMSHGDAAETLPMGFESIASTENSPYAAISSGNTLAVQFHPEVTHTVSGLQILFNFVFEICGCNKNWTPQTMIEDAVQELQKKIGPNDKVICALSGGIDSSTTAEILHRVIGKRLYCVFVDHGLLRRGERKRIESTFRKELGKNLIIVDESKTFLQRLRGVKDPEKKRQIIGREFIKVFSQVRNDLGNVKWLAQGTLYTDIIESAA